MFQMLACVLWQTIHVKIIAVLTDLIDINIGIPKVLGVVHCHLVTAHYLCHSEPLLLILQNTVHLLLDIQRCNLSMGKVIIDLIFGCDVEEWCKLLEVS